jgi:16S rRNA (guanine527-N7)-methyltransferase
LIAWASPLLRTGALGIFPKGQDVERELVDAATCCDVTVTLAPSLTDRDARIALVRMRRADGTREESFVDDRANA